MEKKKRYEWVNGETYCDSDQMYDNETGNKTQPVYVADLLNEQDQKIKDLEAKLAESEKLNKRLQQIVDKLRDKEFAGETLVNAVNVVYEPLYQNKYDEVEQLKQQLAEKEKEAEYQESMKILAVKNQNQTAIAELKKVREYYISNVQWTRHKGLSILEFIDQQIKELKGEK